MDDTSHEELVAHLARLARVSLSADEQAAFAEEIGAILAYVSQIQGDDALPAPRAAAHRNIMRDDDEPHESGAHTEALLAAAPTTKGQYVQVKKIITND